MEKKRIKNHSNSKTKINMIKNMTGMNDPAFQSNKTLKKYINQKLNIYLEQKNNIITKTKTFPRFNDALNSIISSNNKNKLRYPTHQHPSKSNQNNFNTSNISSGSLNKKRINKMNLKEKNNSCIIFKYYNKSLSKETSKKIDNSSSLNVNEKMNVSQFNLINNTASTNKIKNQESISTPINDYIKMKSIYFSKFAHLNKNVGNEENNGKHIIKKNKSNENIINNQKYKNNTQKTPMSKNSSYQITTFKKDINNNSIIKTTTINNYQLKKSYLREESKAYQNKNIKIIRYKYNDLTMHGKENDKNKENDNNNILREKIKDLLKNDESNFENKCPVPMPYVKRYPEYSFKDNKINNNLNLDSIIINKDLKEPVEQKEIPLPTSQIKN